MADLPKYKPDGVTQTRVTRLTGWFIITGGAGVVGSQAGVSSSTSGGQLCGVTWVRTGLGNYGATLHRGYKRMIRGDAQVICPALNTAPNTATDACLAVASTGYFTGATPVPATGGIAITLLQSTGAIVAADPPAGSTFTYDIELADI